MNQTSNLKKLLSLLFLVFTSTIILAQDDCSSAQFLCAGINNPGSTKNKTVEAGDPNICGAAPLNSVWYKTTAYENGTTTITVSDIEDATGFEVQVYTGTCGAMTAIRACKVITSASNYNLDGTTGDDTLQFSVTSGQDYYIMVDINGPVRADNNDNKYSIMAENSIYGRPTVLLTFADGKENKCAGDTFFVSRSTSTLFGPVTWEIEANPDDGYVSWSGNDTAIIFYEPPLDNGDPFEFTIRGYSIESECSRNSNSRLPNVLGVTVAIDTVSPICVGTPSQFIAEAELSDPNEPIDILNWIWTFTDASGSTTDTINTAANPDTTYYTPTSDSVIARLTVQSVACLDSTVLDSFEVRAAFDVNIDPVSQSLCFGTEANISTAPDAVAGLAPFSYTWSTSAVAPDRTDSLGVKINGLGVGGPYEYTVRATDSRGCYGFDTATVTIPASPDLTGSWVTAIPVNHAGTSGFCLGTDATFNIQIAGGTAPYDVTFNMVGDNDDDTVMVGKMSLNENFTVTSIDSTDTMVVSVIDALGCIDTVKFTVPAQSLPLTTNPSICISNNPPAGNLCVFNTSPGSEYVYSGLTVGLVTLDNVNDSCGYLDFTGQTAGDYTFNIEVTNVVTGCVDDISQVVTVDDELDVALMVNDTPICQTACLDIQITGGADLNAVSYVWDNGGAGDTNVYENFCPTGDTTVRVTATLGSCTYYDSIEVEHVIPPAPVVTNLPDSICRCDSLTLDGTGSPVGATIGYEWTSLNGQSIVGNPGLTAKVEMCISDTFIFTVTDSNGMCQSTHRDTVKSINLPSASADANRDSICLGAPTIVALLGLGSSNTPNVHTFSWTSSPAVSITNSDQMNASATIDTMTTFYLVVTDTVIGCSNIDSVKVFVYERTEIVADPAYFCTGNPSKLSVIRSSNYGAGSTFDWSDSPDAAEMTNALTEDTAAVDLNGALPGAYNFRLIVDNGRTPCMDTNDVAINVITSLTLTPNKAVDTICYGDSTTLTVTAPGAQSYIWTVDLTDNDIQNDGRDTTNSITVSPTPLLDTATAYTYKLVATVGLCTDSTSIEVITRPPPVANAKDTSICVSQTAIIANNTANVGDVFAWSPATNLSSTSAANPVVTGAASRDYALLLTDQYGCIDRDTANIIVNSVPSVTFDVLTSKAFVCSGRSGFCDNMYPIQMEYTIVSGTGPYTLNWLPNVDVTESNHGVAINHLIDTALITSDTTIDYKVYVTDVNGCTDSNTQSIEMINWEASGTSVCETDNPPLSTFTVLDNCVGATYDWTASGDIDSIITQTNPTDHQVTANFFGLPSATYSFNVGISDLSGCIDTTQLDFTIGSLFSANFYAFDNPLCKGSCDSLFLSVSGDTSNAEVTLVALLTDDTLYRNLTDYAVEICPVVSQDYELIVVKSGCEDRDTISVVVVDPPVNAYGGEPDTVCAGTTLSLNGTGSATGAGITYTWTSTEGTVITDDNLIIGSMNISTSDTITLTVADANCSVDSVRTVHMNLLPNMMTDFSPDSICVGEPTVVTFDGTGTATGLQYVYEWTTSPAALAIVQKDSLVTNATMNAASAISFSVTDTFTGCMADTTMNLPTYVQSEIIGGTNSFCMVQQDRSTTLEITGEGVGSTYDWSTSADAIYIQSATNTETVDVDVTAGGEGTFEFTCIVVNTRNNCDDTVNYTITVLSSPATSVAVDEDTICAGSFSEMIATGSVNYTWEMDPIHSTLDGQENNDTINVSPSADSTSLIRYDFICIGEVGVCRDTFDQSLWVYPIIAVDAGDDQLACGGDSVRLGGSPTGNASLSFNWLPATDISNVAAQNPFVYPDDTTEYIVTATNSDGCQNRDSVIVNVEEMPTFIFNRVTNDFIDCNADQGYCAKEQIEINYRIEGGSGDFTIAWNHSTYITDQIEGAYDGTIDVAYITPDSTVEYIINIVDNTTGCLFADTQRFTILAPTISRSELCVIDVPQEADFCVNKYCNGASFDWSSSPNQALLNNSVDSCVTADFTGLGAGDYDFVVIVNDPVKSCIDTIPFTYTIEEPVVSTLEVSHPNVCYGFPDTLAVTGDVGGAEFTWVNMSTGDTLPDSTSLLIVYPTTNVRYSVTQNNGGCTRTDQTVITVMPVPEATLTVEDSSCKCDPILLDGTGTDALMNYSWISTAGNTITDPTSMDAAVLNACVSDSVIFRVTDPSNGCYKDTFANVASFPYPKADLVVGADTICNGVNVAVSLDASASVGQNYRLNWHVSSGTLVDPNSLVTDVITDTFTIVTLTLTERESGCDSVIVDTIHLYELASFGTEPDSVCGEDRGIAEICIPNVNPGSTFNWALSDDVDLISTGDTLRECIDIPLDTVEPGLYSFGVAIFDAGNACADTLYKDLRKLDYINMAITSDNSNDSICEGESINLNTIVAETYNWTSIPNDTSIGLQQQNRSINVTPAMNSADVDIQYIVTGTKFFCSDADTLDVFLKGRMELELGESQEVCEDSSYQFNDVVGTNALLTWYDHDYLADTVVGGQFVPDANAENPLYVLPRHHTSHFNMIGILEDTFGICPTLRDTMWLYVREKPFVKFSHEPDTLCSLDKLYMNRDHDYDMNSSNFIWSDGDFNGVFILGENTVDNGYAPNPVVSNSDQYITATVEGHEVCADYDTTVHFYVFQSPIARLNLPDSVCFGHEISMNDTVTGGVGDIITWSNGTLGGMIRTPLDSITNSYMNRTNVGSDTITVTVTSTNALCESATATDVIEVKANPKLTFDNSSEEICIGEPYNVKVGGALDYYWYVIGTSLDTSLIDSGAQFIRTPLNSVQYLLIGIDSFGCEDTISRELLIKPNPPIEIEASYDANQCYPMEVEFSYSRPEIAERSVFWDFQDGTSSTLRNPFHLFKQDHTKEYPHTYPVVLEVNYENGCSQYDTSTIIVCESFDLPNVFTPDGDGINDYFIIPGLSEMEGPCEFEVFDRWGGKVYQASDYQNDWDGSNNQKKTPKPLNPDTYYFVFSCSGEVTWSGWVRIISTKK